MKHKLVWVNGRTDEREEKISPDNFVGEEIISFEMFLQTKNIILEKIEVLLTAEGLVSERIQRFIAMYDIGCLIICCIWSNLYTEINYIQYFL